jgi:polyisoprenoid-binding protein YceI
VLNRAVARRVPLDKMNAQETHSAKAEIAMNLKTRSAWLLAATVVTWAASALAAEWTLVPETSSVGFVAEQQGSRFNGRFQTFTAAVSFDPSAPEHGSIVGTVDTATVNTRDHDRDSALRESDWFDSPKYPQARFTSESITKLADGSYEAAGQLEIKGTTKPARLAFTFAPGASGGTSKLDGKMTIDRFDFKVGQGWNDTSWVGQNVEVHVELELAP